MNCRLWANEKTDSEYINHNKKNDTESVINVYKKQQSSKLFSSTFRHNLNKTANYNVQKFKLQNT